MAGPPTAEVNADLKAPTAKVNEFFVRFGAFEAEARSFMAFSRRIGWMLAAAVLTTGVGVVWQASKLDSRIAAHDEQIGAPKALAEKHDARLDRIERAVDRLTMIVEGKAPADPALAGTRARGPRPRRPIGCEAGGVKTRSGGTRGTVATR